MANPETLSDFVHWGAENYPARKYALLLWDRGGGSKTGIFILWRALIIIDKLL